MDNDPLAPFRREPRPVSKDDQAWEPLTEHQALGLAIGALQQVPDHQPELMFDLQEAYERGREHENLSEVKPQVIRLLQTFKEFINDAERDYGVNYWATKADIEQVLNKIYPERERTPEAAERNHLEQDIDLEPEM